MSIGNTSGAFRLLRGTLRALLLLGLGLLAACSPALPPAATPLPAVTEEPSPTALPTATSSEAPPTEAPPSPTPLAPVRFAVIGDYGLAGEPLAAVAELVIGWAPDFIVTTGDNNYPDGAADTLDANVGQYYHAYIAPYRGAYGQGPEVNRFFPSLGNHDWNTDRAAPHLEYFTLPGNERYYDFVWGPVHLFALDSDSREPDGIGRSSAQADWLQGALAASTAPWKIVYMHHPPFSSALHGSTHALQWPYAEWGASAVLAGHDHVYERLIVGGFPYITNGLGGNPYRYTFNAPLPGSQVRYREKNGAMLVEADASQITFQFVTVDGEVIDSYSLPPGD